LWSSICDLSEMGVIVDTTSLFGVDLNHAVGLVCAGSDRSVSENAAYAQPVSASAATPSRSSDMAEVLEHRRMAESPFLRDNIGFNGNNNGGSNTPGNGNNANKFAINRATQETPSASMSLGMSSLSLRQPFASPISMSLNSLPPASLHRFELQSTSGIDEQAASQQPRVLFDMSPGLTPITNANTTINGLPSVQANAGALNLPPSASGMSMYSNQTPSTDMYIRGGRLAFSTDDHSQQQGQANASNPNNANINARTGGGGGGGTRRVSFGPTARLSFSSSMGAGYINNNLFGNSGGSMGSTMDTNKQVLDTNAHHGTGNINDLSAISPHPLGSDSKKNIIDDSSMFDEEVDDSIYPSKVLRMNNGDDDNSSRFSPARPTGAGLSAVTAPLVQPNAQLGHDSLLMSAFNSGYAQQHLQQQQQQSHDDASSMFTVGTSALLGESTDGRGISTMMHGHGQEAQPGNSVITPNNEGTTEGGNSDKTVSAQCTGIQRAAGLLCIFASAYQSLCFYRCVDCIHILHSLPGAHFKSGWVQHLIGKAYYELCDYKPALLSLKEMVRIEPFRVKGTEILSTVLWHLKREKELCALAQQIVEVDKQAPETWCVVGNCFSLQRETDTAIKYFQRALQLDNRFIYAHTLCGHELVNNEDLDKAVACFRMALLCDDRHYNAWYGLGSIYYRQEKHEMAELHFRRAIAVNPISSVLKCYLSMVLHAQNRLDKTHEALQILADASAGDPRNPQVIFSRLQSECYSSLQFVDATTVAFPAGSYSVWNYDRRRRCSHGRQPSRGM
jgi:tetratricopeptide (TPR) repeat protein